MPPPTEPEFTDRQIIDIRTRFLADDTRVYILFPGYGYRYYGLMEDSSAVFLQLPGFPLFENNQIPTDNEIIRRIVVSDRIMTWHYSQEDGPEPTRDPNQVKNYKSTEARIQLAAFIVHFFTKPKKGDVIIVPCQSQEDMVLFGEFSDDPYSCVGIVSPRDYGEVIPGRSVKWLARIQRSTVPRWLDQRFPSPNPLRQIEKSLHKYIFDLMYERYYYENRFIVKFRTERDKFNTLDSYIINQFFLYVAALHGHIHEGTKEDLSKKTLFEVVASLSFSEDIPDQRISIHSKGYIVSDAANIIPLIAGVMMHMALSSTGVAAQTAPPHIVNSADGGQASQECVLDVENEVAAEMKLMGANRWQELCAAGRTANQSTGVDSGMTTSKPVPNVPRSGDK